WLPRTRIYVDLAAFGLDPTVDAIVARLQDAGGEPREETAVQAAIRRAQEDEQSQRRDAWLRTREAASAAIEAFRQVTESWKTKIAAMNGAGGFACGPGPGTGGFVVRSPRASLAAGWHSPFWNDTKQGRLSVTEYDGWLPGHGLFDMELNKVSRG